MSDAIIVAIITGACAIAAQLIISAKSTSELYAKLDKQSELKDAELKGEIAVIHTEIAELRKNVEKHNSVIDRTYALETEVAKQGEQIKTLFNK
jgi:hypothetical protein